MIPRSFTQVKGWREDFDEAADKLKETRIGSLFPRTEELLGVRIRALTLRTWTILDLTGNSLVQGGELTTADCLRALWILRADWIGLRETSKLARFLRRWRAAGILRRYEEGKVRSLVAAHIDYGFLDMPGRFNVEAPEPSNPVHHPRMSLEIRLASEVMEAFPSMKFEELRDMPLAQFWQWLHRARAIEDPKYRNDQLTDMVNRRYLGKLNAMRRADKAFQENVR